MRGRWTFVAAVVLILGSAQVEAAPADLDDGFGTHGETVTGAENLEEQPFAIAVQPLGEAFRIIVAGRVCPF